VTFSEFCLFLAAVITASGGQLLLKMGALKLGRVSTSNAISHLTNILVTPELVAGLALYGMSAFLFILVLTRVKLSVAGPAVSLGYVFSVLMGYFIFKESISVRLLIGLGLIVCGVILVINNK
jgi:multidrug transporter EmrE-like cation transporter